jgi:hypothetical protein
MQRLGQAMALLTVLQVGAGTIHAAPTPQQCAFKKIKAAGKKAACELAIDAKVAEKGGTADFTKCRSSFSAAFSKADAKGACTTPGDASTIETMVETFAADVFASETGGTPPCVDLTGSWAVNWNNATYGSGTCNLSITQTGTNVSATSDCAAAPTGSLNCSTRHLILTSSPPCSSLTFDATVSEDGNSFGGIYDCGGIGSGGVSATRQ